MSTTGVGSSRPSRTARTLPTCSTRYRVLSSPGRTAMATGCSTWATRTSRTLAARNWAEVAVRAATAVVEGARADVDGAAVVEGAPVDGPAWESGSFPEQAAAARARTRRAAELRASRRMAAIVVGRGQLRSPARADGRSAGAGGEGDAHADQEALDAAVEGVAEAADGVGVLAARVVDAPVLGAAAGGQAVLVVAHDHDQLGPLQQSRRRRLGGDQIQVDAQLGQGGGDRRVGVDGHRAGRDGPDPALGAVGEQGRGHAAADVVGDPEEHDHPGRAWPGPPLAAARHGHQPRRRLRPVPGRRGPRPTRAHFHHRPATSACTYKTPQLRPRFHTDLRRCCQYGHPGPVPRLSAVRGTCCSGPMRRIGVEERRARLGLRHRLAAAARAGVVEAARDLVGLHGTDPASVYLAARARMRDPQVAAVDRALYEDRALVRILGMRRTMFVVPVELMPVVQAACTDAIAVQQRRLLHDMVGRAGMADDPAGWVEELGTVTVKALEASGGATATEVAGYDPHLGLQIVVAEGKPYEGRQ